MYLVGIIGTVAFFFSEATSRASSGMSVPVGLPSLLLFARTAADLLPAYGDRHDIAVWVVKLSGTRAWPSTPSAACCASRSMFALKDRLQGSLDKPGRAFRACPGNRAAAYLVENLYTVV